MSASTTVVTLITSLVGLIATLREMRVVYKKLDRMKTLSGQEHQVELVVESPQGRQIGFQKTVEGHYEATADTHGLGATEVRDQAKFIRKIVQRYAYKKVLDQLKAQGYVVAEEEQKADDTVRLVVRKWV